MIEELWATRIANHGLGRLAVGEPGDAIAAEDVQVHGGTESKKLMAISHGNEYKYRRWKTYNIVGIDTARCSSSSICSCPSRE